MSSPIGWGLIAATLTPISVNVKIHLGSGPAQFSYKQSEQLTTASCGAIKCTQRGVSHFCGLPSSEYTCSLQGPLFSVTGGGCMRSNKPSSSLQPLCYEHHTEMSLVQMVPGNGNTPHQGLEYACQVPNCFVRYTGAHGYFVVPRNGSGLQEEILPSVRCPHDGALMYLGEVRPEDRSFRLWRCPLCKAASASGQVLAAAS